MRRCFARAMLVDADRLRNLFLLLYPAEKRADKRRMLARMGRRMSSWLSAQMILSAIIGVATFITLLCLRIPYALPLAIVATIGEMVPVIGPIIGALPSLAIAILHSRWQFWSVLIMLTGPSFRKRRARLTSASEADTRTWTPV